VLFIALDKYYGLGSKVALILLVATFAQILAVPACAAIARRIGKHRTWGWASILGAVCGPLFLLFPPDGQANIPLLMLLMAVSSAFGTPNMMFPVPMVNDIADYDQLKSGETRNGSYYALRLLIYKATFAIGGSIGLYMLSAVGFDPKLHANSEFARHGLLFTLVVVPNLMFLAAGFILLRFPIDARRHAIIRRRIDARTERAARRALAGEATTTVS
jgi:GPH family glycoside/pentoside/hexuronide:cation symporter